MSEVTTTMRDELLGKDFAKLKAYEDSIGEETIRSAQLILDAHTSPFWKEYFIPKLDRLIAEYDARHQNAKDPWERYGLTEAYRVLCTFKLEILDELMDARRILGG